MPLNEEMKKNLTKLQAIKEDKNYSEAEKDIEDYEKQKDEMGEAQKANEVMHTTNTGAGEELIPTNVLGNPLDLIPSHSNLLNELPGNQGSDMAVSEKVPIIGDDQLFEANSEWTSGGPTPDTDPQSKLSTGEIIISQGQFIKNFDISKREMNYSIADLESIVNQRLSSGAARTMEYMIINADTATSGNVNLYDGSPAGKVYQEFDGGIRDVALNNSASVNVGTLTVEDLLSMLNQIGEYASELNNLMWVVPHNVYLKMLNLQDENNNPIVITRDKNGNNSTFRRGVLGQAFGIDIVSSRSFPSLTNDDGMIYSADADNTKGSFALVYKPAIQYGTGMPVEIDVHKVAGKGVRMYATFEFGSAIAFEKAGLGKTMSVGRNVTVG